MALCDISDQSFVSCLSKCSISSAGACECNTLPCQSDSSDSQTVIDSNADEAAISGNCADSVESCTNADLSSVSLRCCRGDSSKDSPAVNSVLVLLHGLSHSSYHEPSLLVLVEHAAYDAAVDLFVCLWHEQLASQQTHDKIQVHLSCVTEMLNNFAQLLPDTSSMKPTFARLLLFLSYHVPPQFVTWSSRPEFCVLCLDLTSLALKLLANLHSEIQTLSVDTSSLFHSVTAVLSEVVEVEILAGSCSDCTLVACAPYRPLWDCIVTVYCGSILAMADCISQYNDLAHIVLSTGWISSLVHMLTAVKGDASLSPEMLEAFDTLFSALVDHSQAGKEAIENAGGAVLTRLDGFRQFRRCYTFDGATFN